MSLCTVQPLFGHSNTHRSTKQAPDKKLSSFNLSIHSRYYHASDFDPSRPQLRRAAARGNLHAHAQFDADTKAPARRQAAHAEHDRGVSRRRIRGVGNAGKDRSSLRGLKGAFTIRTGVALGALFARTHQSISFFFLCNRNNRMAIASGRMVFYYMARDNLCFLTLCEEAYPKRLAFLYLDEIADLILQEMLQEYGANVRLGMEYCVAWCARAR